MNIQYLFMGCTWCWSPGPPPAPSLKIVDEYCWATGSNRSMVDHIVPIEPYTTRIEIRVCQKEGYEVHLPGAISIPV